MAVSSKLDPGRVDIEGGRTGILLLHGYTGSPPDVTPMAKYLGGKGMTVVAPLLPGHGTSPEDLNTRSWREVAQAAREEFYALQSRCDTVFVGGLSMGGLLTLHLGQTTGGIAGLIPMAPAVYLRDPLHRLLPLAKHFISSLPKSKDPKLSVEDESCLAFLLAYDRNPLRFADEVVGLMHHVRDRLSELSLPMLVFHGEKDRSVPTRAARAVVERSQSSDAQLVLLEHSGHCLCVDQEREQVFARTWQWIQDHR